MGYTRRYAGRVDLTGMRPRPELASTGYCLARPGAEYLVYNPDAKARSFEVTLAAGAYECEWFNPSTGEVMGKERIEAEQGRRTFAAPFEADAVLYLRRTR